jgi:hypothetical protein
MQKPAKTYSSAEDVEPDRDDENLTIGAAYWTRLLERYLE